MRKCSNTTAEGGIGHAEIVELLAVKLGAETNPHIRQAIAAALHHVSLATHPSWVGHTNERITLGPESQTRLLNVFSRERARRADDPHHASRDYENFHVARHALDAISQMAIHGREDAIRPMIEAAMHGHEKIHEDAFLLLMQLADHYLKQGKEFPAILQGAMRRLAGMAVKRGAARKLRPLPEGHYLKYHARFVADLSG